VGAKERLAPLLWEEGPSGTRAPREYLGRGITVGRFSESGGERPCEAEMRKLGKGVSVPFPVPGGGGAELQRSPRRPGAAT
jgi:hypothetical protein